MKFKGDVDSLVRSLVPPHMVGSVGAHLNAMLDKHLTAARISGLNDAAQELKDIKFPSEEDHKEKKAKKKRKKIKKVKK